MIGKTLLCVYCLDERSGMIGKTSLCLYCWDEEWCDWKDFIVSVLLG